MEALGCSPTRLALARLEVWQRRRGLGRVQGANTTDGICASWEPRHLGADDREQPGAAKVRFRARLLVLRQDEAQSVAGELRPSGRLYLLGGHRPHGFPVAVVEVPAEPDGLVPSQVEGAVASLLVG